MKVKLRIPTELNDITLSEYQKYNRLIELATPADILNLKLIEIFCGVKLNDVRDISLKDLNEIISEFEKVFKKKPKFVNRFKIDGTEYGFIPDIESISSGEYVDLKQYIFDLKDAHKAMAVMYRPITMTKGDGYLIEDYEGSSKYAQEMKRAPLGVVLAAQFFFANLTKDLLRNFLKYSAEVIKKNPQLLEDIQPSGDGMLSFIESLKGSYGCSILYPN